MGKKITIYDLYTTYDWLLRSLTDPPTWICSPTELTLVRTTQRKASRIVRKRGWKYAAIEPRQTKLGHLKAIWGSPL